MQMQIQITRQCCSFSPESSCSSFKSSERPVAGIVDPGLPFPVTPGVTDVAARTGSAAVVFAVADVEVVIFSSMTAAARAQRERRLRGERYTIVVVPDYVVRAPDFFVE